MFHSLAKLTGPQLSRKSFVEDEDASSGHDWPHAAQEDFGSATSVGLDVVKMTDLKLDPVLAEGGGEPGKNRFDDKQTKDNPFLISSRYRIKWKSTGQNPFWRRIIKETKNKLGHDTGSVSDPFDNLVTYSHSYE